MLFEYTGQLSTPSIVALRNHEGLNSYVIDCEPTDAECLDDWLGKLKRDSIEPTRSIKPAQYPPNVPPYDYKSLINSAKLDSSNGSEPVSDEYQNMSPGGHVPNPIVSKPRINDEL